MGTPVVPGASLEHRVPVPFSVVLRSGAGMKSSQTDRGITARSSTLTPEKTILATAAKHLRSGRSAWTGSADATVVNPRTRSVRAGIIAVGARVFQKRPLAFLRRRKKLLPGMQFTLPKVWSGASASAPTAFRSSDIYRTCRIASRLWASAEADDLRQNRTQNRSGASNRAPQQRL
jgi:hypothetical protein